MEAEKDAAAQRLHPAEKRAQEDVILARAEAVKVRLYLHHLPYMKLALFVFMLPLTCRKGAAVPGVFASHTCNGCGARRPGHHRQQAHVMQRKRGDKTSPALDDAPSGAQPKRSHWSYVLSEALWLSRDVRQERIWKKKMAYLFAHEIAKSKIQLRPVSAEAPDGKSSIQAEEENGVAANAGSRRTPRNRCITTTTYDKCLTGVATVSRAQSMILPSAIAAYRYVCSHQSWEFGNVHLWPQWLQHGHFVAGRQMRTARAAIRKAAAAIASTRMLSLESCASTSPKVCSSPHTASQVLAVTHTPWQCGLAGLHLAVHKSIW